MDNAQIRKDLGELLALLQRGEIVEGLQKFYADDVSMRENRKPPTVGLQANIERELKFQQRIKRWHGVDVQALAVDGGYAFIEYTMCFTDAKNRRVSMGQVSVQRWVNGKVLTERFFYDSSGD